MIVVFTQVIKGRLYQIYVERSAIPSVIYLTREEAEELVKIMKEAGF